MSMIHLESDFERWPEVRSLAVALGSQPAGVLAVVQLWRELAELVPVTRRVGFIPVELATELARSIGVPLDRLTQGAVPLLCQIEDGWVARRFADAHRHLDPAHKPLHLQGAAISRHRRDVRKFAGQVVTQSLFIPPDWLKDQEGKAWDHDQVKQVMLVIRAFDNALGLPQRQPTESGYTQSLLSDTRTLLLREGWERIAIVAEALIGLDHPAIPRTTEKLVQQFDQIRALPEVLGALK